jgi:hypothetical protein
MNLTTVEGATLQRKKRKRRMIASNNSAPSIKLNQALPKVRPKKVVVAMPSMAPQR